MKFCISIFCLLLSTAIASASHIAGGEMRITHKGPGPYDYHLEMIMFFDDIHAEPGLINNDLVINVYIFEKYSNASVGVYQLPRVDDKEYIIDDTVGCSVLGTRILRYRAGITLDPAIYNSEGGYYAVWQRCCRNEMIANIQAPDNVGNAFYCEFPAVKGLDGSNVVNSTPVFSEPHKEILCKNNYHQINFSAIDADQDSLVYSLVHPFAGHGSLAPGGGGAAPEGYPAPYPLIKFEAGYAVDSMIPGQPALTIDSFTGILSVNPSKEGLFAFAVQVEEYREGKRIGLSRRDYQVLVLDCTDSIPMPCYAHNHDPGHHHDSTDVGVTDPIKAYPNPAISELYITSEDDDSGLLQVNIFNAVGSLVLSEQVASGDRVFVSALTTGLYYIWVIPEKGEPQKISLLKK